MTVMSSTRSGHNCSMTNPKLSSNKLVLLTPCENGLVYDPWNTPWPLRNDSMITLVSMTLRDVSQNQLVKHSSSFHHPIHNLIIKSLIYIITLSIGYLLLATQIMNIIKTLSVCILNLQHIKRTHLKNNK